MNHHCEAEEKRGRQGSESVRPKQGWWGLNPPLSHRLTYILFILQTKKLFVTPVQSESVGKPFIVTISPPREKNCIPLARGRRLKDSKEKIYKYIFAIMNIHKRSDPFQAKRLVIVFPFVVAGHAGSLKRTPIRYV